MKRAARVRAGLGVSSGWNLRHLAAIYYVAAALWVAGAMLSSGVAQAEGQAESTPEAAQAVDPRQLCYGAESSA